MLPPIQPFALLSRQQFFLCCPRRGSARRTSIVAGFRLFRVTKGRTVRRARYPLCKPSLVLRRSNSLRVTQIPALAQMGCGQGDVGVVGVRLGHWECGRRDHDVGAFEAFEGGLTLTKTMGRV